MSLDDTEPPTLILTPQSSVASALHLVTNLPRVSKITAHLALVILAVSIGSGFTFGYNIGVINSPESAMRKYYNQSLTHRIEHPTSEWGLNMFWASAVAAVPLGAIIGSVIANMHSQNYGRKQMLMANNFMGIVGCALEIWSAAGSVFEAFLAGRVMMGIYIGVNGVIAPIYLNEVSPLSFRGSIGTSFQLSITVGVFASQVMGLKQVFGKEETFYRLFVVNLCVCSLQFLMLHFCPESPKFLLLFKSDAFGALSSLRKLRGCSDVSEDLTEIDSECISSTTNEALSQNGRRSLLTFAQVLSKPALRKLLLNAMVLNITAVFCGIGAVLFYCDVIVQNVGIDKHESPLYVCGVFAIPIPFTFVAAFVIELLGRRPLILAGLTGTTLSCVLLMITNVLNAHLELVHVKTLLITSLVSFIFFFSLGPGPIPWLMVPELLPSNARSVVGAASLCINLFSMFLVGIGFPTLNSVMGPYVFVIFIAMSIVCGVTLYFSLPETKGKTSDEILLTLESTMSAERDQYNTFCFLKLANVDHTIIHSVDPIF